MTDREIVEYYGQIWENVEHMTSYINRLREEYLLENQNTRDMKRKLNKKEIKKLREWSELDYEALELEERLAPYQEEQELAELEMEKYLKERIKYYESIYGYGKEQKKVLQEALEYFIKLKNK